MSTDVPSDSTQDRGSRTGAVACTSRTGSRVAIARASRPPEQHDRMDRVELLPDDVSEVLGLTANLTVASEPSRQHGRQRTVRRASAGAAAGHDRTERLGDDASGRGPATSCRRSRGRGACTRRTSVSERPETCHMPVMPGRTRSRSCSVVGPLLDLGRQRRPGPDDAHLAAQHVPELRDLVDRQLAQEPADPGDSRVVADLEQRPVALVLDRSARPCAARRRRPSCAT